MWFKTSSRAARHPGISITAAVLTAISTTAILPVAAHAEASVKTSAVHYQDLDLSVEQDAQRLYSRLKFAARSVCAPLGGRTQGERQAFRQCMTESLTNAVKQVNATQLSKLHGQAEAVRIAQRQGS